ncbi:hypothetical protein V5G20_26930 (plasmid) [Brevibacillus borstelensis]|uniref:hypothetical protein n=1 Tax=Brevibacillus borstelensis TaxID=45462 RepID=UPI0030D05C97
MMYTMPPTLRDRQPSIGAADVYIFDDLASCSTSEMYTSGSASDEIRTQKCIQEGGFRND